MIRIIRDMRVEITAIGLVALIFGLIMLAIFLSKEMVDWSNFPVQSKQQMESNIQRFDYGLLTFSQHAT